MGNACYVKFWAFLLWLYACVTTAHSLHRILRYFWRIAAQWMGSGYSCIHSQKGSPKLDITCISHSIRSILQLFLFDIAPNLLTLHAPQWNVYNPNKYGINRKANKQALQRYLTWWIKIQDKRNIINQSCVVLLFLKGVYCLEQCTKIVAYNVWPTMSVKRNLISYEWNSLRPTAS